MANNAIGILFEVQGGGDINGASGKRINGQLRNLIGQINKSDTVKLKFQVDSNYINQQVKQLQQQLQTLSNSGATSNKNSKGTNSTQEQSRGYTEARRTITEYYKAQTQLQRALSRTKEIVIDEEGNITSASKRWEALKNYVDQTTLAYKKLLDESGKISDDVLAKFDTSKRMSFDMDTKNITANAEQAWANLTAKVHDYIDRVEYAASQNSKAAQGLMDLRDMANNTDYHGYDALKKKLAEVNQYINENAFDTETWWQKTFKTFGSKVRSAIAGVVTAKLGLYLKQVYDNVVNLDKAMVDLQIASGKTRKETEKLIKTYSKLAQRLGATTADVAASADTWLRQGYSTEEANTLIANSMMLSKLGQIESAEAAKNLTSAMKGYQVSVNNSIEIVDKFTAVDMEAAASAGDMATAMAETATSAGIAGVSMDKLIGYIATDKEVTQDSAESVGTFYKTLFARMNNVAAGNFVDEETGESLNDVEKVLGKLGIFLRDTSGQFRNSGEVLDEVASRWKNFDSVSQHAIATAFSGTRQQEKFIVLMENYGSALRYAEVSANSAGTATEKFADYSDGLEAKINSLTAKFEELSLTLLDAGWVSTGINVLNGFLEVLIGIASIGDGVVVGLVAMFVATSLLNAAFTVGKEKIKALITKYAKLAGVQVTGTITTKAFTAALFQFSSTGLLGVLTTIPRLIIAFFKYIAATKAGTGATIEFKRALDLLKVNPWVLLIEVILLAIAGAVAGINALANASAKASKEAKEHAKAMKEAADKAEEEQNALDDLIDKYEELKSRGTIDADTRKEIRDVQEQINLLVKGEAAEWDMVNGSLDENLKKLKQLRAEKAGENLDSYSQSFSAAQNSSNLAYESDRAAAGWAKWAASWAGIDIIVDGWDKQAAEILNSVEGVSADWETNFVSLFTSINFDADGADEHVARITAAMNALKNDMNYDHLHSAVYQQLASLKSVYESYTSASIEAADQLLEGVVLFSGATIEANGLVIESLEDYNAFRQSMIDAAMSSDYLKDALASQAVTQQTVTKAVEDYLAENYGDLYDELANKVNGIVVELKSMNSVLEEMQYGFDGLCSAMRNVTSEGYLTADALASLAKLEEDGALAGLKLADILVADAKGYKLVTNVLELYVKAILDAKKAEIANIAAFATEEDRKNALANIELYRRVLATLLATTEDSTDATEKQREALESEKEMYGDQMDAFGELIELRKELLQTYAEEVSYQEELAKKQRAVATLQQKLSVAKLDGSAAGQARVRELEAELQNAQDALNDFTLEHAIDVLTAQLEAEAVETENFFQQHLDRIESLLAGLDVSPEVNIDTSWAGTLLEEFDNLKTEVENKIVTDEDDDSGGNSGGRTTIGGTYDTYEEYSRAWYAANEGMYGPPSPPAAGQVKENTKTPTTTAKSYAQTGLNIDTTTYTKEEYNSKIKKDSSGNTYLPYTAHGKKGEWVKLNEGYTYEIKDDKYKIDWHSFKTTYKLTTSYHTGGLVGDIATLSSSEEFAKLLKGEFVSTPSQMKRFMEETLPSIASYQSGGNNEFNAPLIEIRCESVTTEALPELERVVNDAVREIKKQLDSGMSRTGFKRTPTKRLT